MKTLEINSGNQDFKSPKFPREEKHKEKTPALFVATSLLNVFVNLASTQGCCCQKWILELSEAAQNDKTKSRIRSYHSSLELKDQNLKATAVMRR